MCLPVTVAKDLLFYIFLKIILRFIKSTIWEISKAFVGRMALGHVVRQYVMVANTWQNEAAHLGRVQKREEEETGPPSSSVTPLVTQNLSLSPPLSFQHFVLVPD